jgi:hypothetical protein
LYWLLHLGVVELRLGKNRQIKILRKFKEMNTRL